MHADEISIGKIVVLSRQSKFHEIMAQEALISVTINYNKILDISTKLMRGYDIDHEKFYYFLEMPCFHVQKGKLYRKCNQLYWSNKSDSDAFQLLALSKLQALWPEYFVTPESTHREKMRKLTLEMKEKQALAKNASRL